MYKNDNYIQQNRSPRIKKKNEHKHPNERMSLITHRGRLNL